MQSMERLMIHEAPMTRKARKIGVILGCLLSFVVIMIICLLYVGTAPLPDEYYLPYSPIPSSFTVNSTYLIPPSNQYNRGTCWIFAAIFLLESQYRHQGIENGWLGADEYVKFSEEAYGQAIVKYCKANPSVDICRTRLEGKVSAGSVEQFLQFMRILENSKDWLLPWTSCPFQDVEDEPSITCPNSTVDGRNNPLSFEITNTELRLGIDQVKHMLYEAQKPISFSIPNPVNRYWFDCDEPIVKDSEMCVQKLYPCPGAPDKFCGPMEYHLSKPHYAEHLFRRGKDVTLGVPHAIVAVGYNDDFVEPVPVNITGKPPSKGGFILRNSWGSRGHSVEYFSGKITKEQEDSICPNSDDPMGWIPATLDCMQAQKNPSECSTDLRKRYGQSIVEGAQQLKCINETHCDKNKKYVLLRNPHSTQPMVRLTKTGLPLASVIEYDDETEPKIVEITSLPFDHFYYAFQLIDKVENDEKHCGYYFFHYDTVREIMRRTHRNTANWRGIRLDVEWSRDSYASHGKKNYTRIKESTYKFKALQTNDPSHMFEKSEL